MGDDGDDNNNDNNDDNDDKDRMKRQRVVAKATCRLKRKMLCILDKYVFYFSIIFQV